MSDAKKVSRRIFEEVWNNKNIAAIDELVAADYVHHDPQSPKFADGREGYRQLVEYYLKAFPDSHFTIDQEIQEGGPSSVRAIRGRWPGFPASRFSCIPEQRTARRG
jgi:predicted SnoaL-like aldol condensation-catalyzing enzyme